MPTAEQQQAVGLIRHGFELYMAGDVESMLELYDPEAVVTAPDFMNPGPYHGHAGYLEWMERWNEAWESLEFEVGEIVPAGERHVVADVLVRGQGSTSGVQVEVQAAWLFEMREGRALYLEVLSSHERALDLAERRERSDA